MPRGTTPLKRTELKRGTSQLKRSPMPRGSAGPSPSDGPTPPNGPVKRRKPGQSAAEKHGRDVVYPRAGGWCEIQLAGVCAGRAAQWHHRLNRSQGGTWAPSNGLHVCVPCHAYVTDGERAEAKAKGWAVAPGVTPPAEVPVLRRGEWVLLDDEGGITPVELGGAA